MNPTALEKVLGIFRNYKQIRTFLNHENKIHYDARVNLQQKGLLNKNNFIVCVSKFFDSFKAIIDPPPQQETLSTIFQSSFRFCSNYILQFDHVYLYIFFFFSSSLKRPRQLLAVHLTLFSTAIFGAAQGQGRVKEDPKNL